MPSQPHEVRKRNVRFTNRTVTRIWEEVPVEKNQFLAGQCRCHGYDILELAQKRSFVDVLFLLFQGELPSAEQANLLEILLITMINLGPRHPATRAAMNAGVGKTHGGHLLPIGLSILSGAHLGGEEVTEAMLFLRKNRGNSPGHIATELLQREKPKKGDWHIAHGFGSRFGAIDPMPQQIAELLGNSPGSRDHLQWGSEFVNSLLPHSMGWLSTGVAAAVFCDLGFHPRAGAGLYQLLSAPGILAHGLELANKPIVAMPFLQEEQYVIAADAKK
jgi:citrate synthase